ncbi:MAG: hypothetical protein SRB1_01027 [Desulfobacteraceae bacterium Eth-SRB1]|nr:MAG: hypothetical protein SRB1_01027 [Desulfobacteraceae bacterium Eth-SRB1]
MVKQQKKNNRKKHSSKGFTANSAKAGKHSMPQRNMRPVMSSLAHLAAFWRRSNFLI